MGEKPGQGQERERKKTELEQIGNKIGGVNSFYK